VEFITEEPDIILEVSFLMVGKGKKSDSLKDIIQGCPCFKEEGSEQLCLNDDQITDVEFIPLEPELLDLDSIRHDIEDSGVSNVCFQLLRIDRMHNRLFCISKNSEIRIQHNLVSPVDLIDAVELLTGGLVTNHSIICNECLYGVLDSFQSKNTLVR